MKNTHSKQIACNIADTGSSHKQQRAYGIPIAAQECAESIIFTNEENTGYADKDILIGLCHRCLRYLQQLKNHPCAEGQYQAQDNREQCKKGNRGTDRLFDFIRLLPACIFCDKNGSSQCQSGNHACDYLCDLCAGGYRRNAFRRTISSDNHQVSRPVQCLQQIGKQKRYRKAQQYLQNISLCK